MCTRIFWKQQENGPRKNIVGRVMDGAEWLSEWKQAGAGTRLWLFPAGVAHKGGGGKAKEWTSKYPSLVAYPWWIDENRQERSVSTDGVNDQGLAAHTLTLGSANYPPWDGQRPTLSSAWWVQFCLDNFRTVQEAVDFFDETKPDRDPADDIYLQDWQRSIPGFPAQAAKLQLTLEDSSGDCAVIEFTDKGDRHVHHGKTPADFLPVVTNRLTCEDMKEIRQKKPEEKLVLEANPNSPQARFVRALALLENLARPDDTRQEVGYLLSVLRCVSQPFENPKKAGRVVRPTWWRSVIDLNQLVYYFETTLSPNLIWIDLEKVFSEAKLVRRLDVTDRQHDLCGDVSELLAAPEMILVPDPIPASSGPDPGSQPAPAGTGAHGTAKGVDRTAGPDQGGVAQ